MTQTRKLGINSPPKYLPISNSQRMSNIQRMTQIYIYFNSPQFCSIYCYVSRRTDLHPKVLFFFVLPTTTFFFFFLNVIHFSMIFSGLCYFEEEGDFCKILLSTFLHHQMFFSSAKLSLLF